jgi:hypothetical protein
MRPVLSQATPGETAGRRPVLERAPPGEQEEEAAGKAAKQEQVVVPPELLERDAAEQLKVLSELMRQKGLAHVANVSAQLDELLNPATQTPEAQAARARGRKLVTESLIRQDDRDFERCSAMTYAWRDEWLAIAEGVSKTINVPTGTPEQNAEARAAWLEVTRDIIAKWTEGRREQDLARHMVQELTSSAGRLRREAALRTYYKAQDDTLVFENYMPLLQQALERMMGYTSDVTVHERAFYAQLQVARVMAGVTSIPLDPASKEFEQLLMIRGFDDRDRERVKQLLRTSPERFTKRAQEARVEQWMRVILSPHGVLDAYQLPLGLSIENFTQVERQELYVSLVMDVAVRCIVNEIGRETGTDPLAAQLLQTQTNAQDTAFVENHEPVVFRPVNSDGHLFSAGNGDGEEEEELLFGDGSESGGEEEDWVGERLDPYVTVEPNVDDLHALREKMMDKVKAETRSLLINDFGAYSPANTDHAMFAGLWRELALDDPKAMSVRSARSIHERIEALVAESPENNTSERTQRPKLRVLRQVFETIAADGVKQVETDTLPALLLSSLPRMLEEETQHIFETDFTPEQRRQEGTWEKARKRAAERNPSIEQQAREDLEHIVRHTRHLVLAGLDDDASLEKTLERRKDLSEMVKDHVRTSAEARRRTLQEALRGLASPVEDPMQEDVSDARAAQRQAERRNILQEQLGERIRLLLNRAATPEEEAEDEKRWDELDPALDVIRQRAAARLADLERQREAEGGEEEALEEEEEEEEEDVRIVGSQAAIDAVHSEKGVEGGQVRRSKRRRKEEEEEEEEEEVQPPPAREPVVVTRRRVARAVAAPPPPAPEPAVRRPVRRAAPAPKRRRADEKPVTREEAAERLGEASRVLEQNVDVVAGMPSPAMRHRAFSPLNYFANANTILGVSIVAVAAGTLAMYLRTGEVSATSMSALSGVSATDKTIEKLRQELPTAFQNFAAQRIAIREQTQQLIGLFQENPAAFLPEQRELVLQTARALDEHGPAVRQMAVAIDSVETVFRGMSTNVRLIGRLHQHFYDAGRRIGDGEPVPNVLRDTAGLLSDLSEVTRSALTAMAQIPAGDEISRAQLAQRVFQLSMASGLVQSSVPGFQGPGGAPIGAPTGQVPSVQLLSGIQEASVLAPTRPEDLASDARLVLPSPTTLPTSDRQPDAHVTLEWPSSAQGQAQQQVRIPVPSQVIKVLQGTEAGRKMFDVLVRQPLIQFKTFVDMARGDLLAQPNWVASLDQFTGATTQLAASAKRHNILNTTVAGFHADTIVKDLQGSYEREQARFVEQSRHVSKNLQQLFNSLETKAVEGAMLEQPVRNIKESLKRLSTSFQWEKSKVDSLSDELAINLERTFYDMQKTLQLTRAADLHLFLAGTSRLWKDNPQLANVARKLGGQGNHTRVITDATKATETAAADPASAAALTESLGLRGRASAALMSMASSGFAFANFLVSSFANSPIATGNFRAWFNTRLVIARHDRIKAPSFAQFKELHDFNANGGRGALPSFVTDCSDYYQWPASGGPNKESLSRARVKDISTMLAENQLPEDTSGYTPAQAEKYMETLYSHQMCSLALIIAQETDASSRMATSARNMMLVWSRYASEVSAIADAFNSGIQLYSVIQLVVSCVAGVVDVEASSLASLVEAIKTVNTQLTSFESSIDKKRELIEQERAKMDEAQRATLDAMDEEHQFAQAVDSYTIRVLGKSVELAPGQFMHQHARQKYLDAVESLNNQVQTVYKFTSWFSKLVNKLAYLPGKIAKFLQTVGTAATYAAAPFRYMLVARKGTNWGSLLLLSMTVGFLAATGFTTGLESLLPTALVTAAKALVPEALASYSFLAIGAGSAFATGATLNLFESILVALDPTENQTWTRGVRTFIRSVVFLGALWWAGAFSSSVLSTVQTLQLYGSRIFWDFAWSMGTAVGFRYLATITVDFWFYGSAVMPWKADAEEQRKQMLAEMTPAKQRAFKYRHLAWSTVVNIVASLLSLGANAFANELYAGWFNSTAEGEYARSVVQNMPGAATAITSFLTGMTTGMSQSLQDLRPPVSKPGDWVNWDHGFTAVGVMRDATMTRDSLEQQLNSIFLWRYPVGGSVGATPSPWTVKSS